jgi:hypothetical protein
MAKDGDAEAELNVEGEKEEDWRGGEDAKCRGGGRGGVGECGMTWGESGGEVCVSVVCVVFIADRNGGVVLGGEHDILMVGYVT